MTREVVCSSLAELQARITQDMAILQENLGHAIQRTAEAAVPIIASRVPVAFGDLKESVHATKMKTVVDAPHAAAVEIGSMPHRPDMARLIAWVKLRGMQGLNRSGQVRSSKTPSTRFGVGPTTKGHALAIAHELKRHENSNGSLDIDAPERIADRIASEIEKHGTRPHWFTRSSLPAIRKALDEEIRTCLGK